MKVGDKIKNKRSGAIMQIVKVGNPTLTCKVIDIGDGSVPNLHIGKIEKTSSKLIGVTYDLVQENKMKKLTLKEKKLDITERQLLKEYIKKLTEAKYYRYPDDKDAQDLLYSFHKGVNSQYESIRHGNDVNKKRWEGFKEMIVMILNNIQEFDSNNKMESKQIKESQSTLKMNLTKDQEFADIGKFLRGAGIKYAWSAELGTLIFNNSLDRKNAAVLLRQSKFSSLMAESKIINENNTYTMISALREIVDDLLLQTELLIDKQYGKLDHNEFKNLWYKNANSFENKFKVIVKTLMKSGK